MKNILWVASWCFLFPIFAWTQEQESILKRLEKLEKITKEQEQKMGFLEAENKSLKEELEQVKLIAPLNKVQIGTIIASILDYQAFLDINHQNQTSFDITKSTWAYCDGRIATGSVYGAKKTNLPDLRGVFIRGINDMGLDGVPPAKNDQLNPEQKTAGEYQSDAFKSHEHGIIWTVRNPECINGNWNNVYPGLPNTYNHIADNSSSKGAGATGGNETRPKNVTVYYYIRIN